MGLFTIAHLPNPILTVLTLLWGWASCRLFLRYRNLYTLAMAHAILGISIAITIPGPVDHNMRVGLGYLTYNPNKFTHRSQMDQTVSTQAWVMADAPYASILAPCPAIEDSRQRSQYHVAPIEESRTLIEVRQAKKDCGQKQRRGASHAPFQQVLQPSAKEELFRNGDEEEGEDECAAELRQARPE